MNGSSTFHLSQAGEQVTLHVGDRIELSPGVVHDTVVCTKGVTCLEAHKSVTSKTEERCDESFG